MRDVFVEIWESIRRNKLRTCLTGFAVAWGIFMLIVLLGAGNGIMNTFDDNSEGISVNTMEVYGNSTSKPYGGFKQGRRIELDEHDMALTASPAFSDHVGSAQPERLQDDLRQALFQRRADGSLSRLRPNELD